MRKLLRGSSGAPASYQRSLHSLTALLPMLYLAGKSQVSQLWPPAADGLPGIARHWFTATPDPQRSIFKPFTFPRSASGQPPQTSTHTAAAPAPRNPPHALWRAWQAVYERRGGRRPSVAALRDLEVLGLDPAGAGLSFVEAVQRELELYGRGPTDGMMGA